MNLNSQLDQAVDQINSLTNQISYLNDQIKMNENEIGSLRHELNIKVDEIERHKDGIQSLREANRDVEKSNIEKDSVVIANFSILSTDSLDFLKILDK
jgi:chromosome segregation ATPase